MVRSCVTYKGSMSQNLLQPRLSQDKICLASWLPKHRVVVPAGCLDCLMCELTKPCTCSIIDYAWKSLQNTKIGLYSQNWSPRFVLTHFVLTSVLQAHGPITTRRFPVSCLQHLQSPPELHTPSSSLSSTFSATFPF